jgi:hypothetical protein
MELMESLEPLIVLRNQQVAGSIPAGGSNLKMHARLRSKQFLIYQGIIKSDIQNGF